MIDSFEQLEDLASSNYNIANVLDPKAHTFMQQYQSATYTHWMGKAVSHGLRNSFYTMSSTVAAIAAAKFSEREDIAFLSGTAGLVATWFAISSGRHEATTEYNAGIAAKTSALAFETAHVNNLATRVSSVIDSVDLSDRAAVQDMLSRIKSVRNASLSQLRAAYRSAGFGSSEATQLTSSLRVVLDTGISRLQAAV